ncbi:alkaline shock response membrane anchor protein AmaP [Amycolatopsis sp. OK19-0408]|uniref:Alkaline shock response membrane anchor protein AmaP n=1 Tax=Amycolatopsis iheyensis TaxID=2945988 RepID=A0A9X2SRU4_9PSEU|nr:alkaline shock response membrane anchor protein AmaP [Amycolatopsis iheyensis]MCR6490765.1 alkaline shock response membrane anchor protein AmaP [Amycolatopsis iheyensis]
MKRRPRRSTPAALVAVVLLAGCVPAAVVAIQAIFGKVPWISYSGIADRLHATHWNDFVPVLAGAAAALLGLVLLAAALLPGRLVVVPLRGETDSGASRRSYRSTLRAAASDVDGVTAATLKVKRRKVTARVRTARTNVEGLPDAVRTAIERRLAQIAPATTPAVKVRVTSTRSKS